MFGWFRKLNGHTDQQAQDAQQHSPALPAETTPFAMALNEERAESAIHVPAELETNSHFSQPRNFTGEPLLTAKATAPFIEVAAPLEAGPSPELPATHPEPARVEPESTSASWEARPRDVPEPYGGLIRSPSARPAMPLSAHPNYAGLGLAPAPQHPPRLLQPEAALTAQAQEALLHLFEDLFGPNGRYRLEWRTDRTPGDDAVFAEIMTADLVRRVQNAIADTAQLERPESLRAITSGASPDDPNSPDQESDHKDSDTLQHAS